VGATTSYRGYVVPDFQVGGSFQVASRRVFGSAGIALGMTGFSVPCLETRSGVTCGTEEEDFLLSRPLPAVSLPLQLGVSYNRWGFGLQWEPALGLLPAGSMTTWEKSGKKTDVPYLVEQSLQWQLPVGIFVSVNL